MEIRIYWGHSQAWSVNKGHTLGILICIGHKVDRGMRVKASNFWRLQRADTQ